MTRLLCNRYARFLQAFTGNTDLATSALESARDGLPSLEGDFELFCRLRSVQEKRQVRCGG